MAYATASLLWSLDPLGGGVWFATLVASAVVGTWIRDLRRVWAAYVAIIVVCSGLLITLVQSNLWIINQDIVACLVALALAASLAYEFVLWLTIPVFLTVIAWAQSRGAILAAGIAFGLWLWSRSRLAVVALVLCALAAVVYLSGSRMDDIARRLGVWQDTVNHLTLLGSGLGSFATAYAHWPMHINMTLTLAPHAYNDWLEVLFELGLGAIPLFWLIAIAFEDADAAPRLVALTFLALGATYFPLFIFPIGQMFALTLGAMLAPQLERLSYGSLASSGPSLPARPRY